MSYFPQIKVIHSSTTFHGQVYIPFANWLLMIGSVIVTAVYSDTTSLGHAYGVCVVLVAFITTNFVLLVAIIVWRINPIIAFAIWLPFITLDGLYLSSALQKVPQGAWFTLLLAIVLSGVFILWRFGKGEQWEAERQDRIPASALIERDQKNPEVERLSVSLGGGRITGIKGLGIFFDKAGAGIPASYLHFLLKTEARPEVQIFLHLRALSIPTVKDDDPDKYTVAPVPGISFCYRVVGRYGYNDQIVTKELGGLVYTHVRRHIIRTSRSYKPFPAILTAAREADEAERKAANSNTLKPVTSKPSQSDTGTSPDTAESVNNPIATPVHNRTTSTATDHMAEVEDEVPDAEGLTAADRRAQRRLREFLLAAQPLGGDGVSTSDDPVTASTLAALDRAYATQILYVVGKSELRVPAPQRLSPERRAGGWRGQGISSEALAETRWRKIRLSYVPYEWSDVCGTRALRRVALYMFLWVRDNSRKKVAGMKIPVEKLIEVGFVKEI